MYTLPTLPYDHKDLEPYIDAQTMEIHHTKHHQGYINKLNDALKDHSDLLQKPVEELVSELNSLPEKVQNAIRNNGGGHANHSLFWTILTPSGTDAPSGSLAEEIEDKFGSLEEFKAEFTSTAGSQFGSGWGWLVVTADKNLAVISTPNQDSPLTSGKTPILGVDVWEHAYYLNYQNKRPDYLEAFWNIVNWTEVERRYEAAIA